jgi:hypothetical protein
MATTALLLESSNALTAEEQMLLASGTYGAGSAGSYGGLFEDVGSDLALESSPSAPAPAPAAPAKSSALSAHGSAALLAGAAIAVSALVL